MERKESKRTAFLTDGLYYKVLSFSERVTLLLDKSVVGLSTIGLPAQVHKRILQRVGTGKCKTCQTTLRQVFRPKHDPFWITLGIFVGAALAFFLVGNVLMATGLWLLNKQDFPLDLSTVQASS